MKKIIILCSLVLICLLTACNNSNYLSSEPINQIGNINDLVGDIVFKQCISESLESYLVRLQVDNNYAISQTYKDDSVGKNRCSVDDYNYFYICNTTIDEKEPKICATGKFIRANKIKIVDSDLPISTEILIKDTIRVPIEKETIEVDGYACYIYKNYYKKPCAVMMVSNITALYIEGECEEELFKNLLNGLSVKQNNSSEDYQISYLLEPLKVNGDTISTSIFNNYNFETTEVDDSENVYFNIIDASTGKPIADVVYEKVVKEKVLEEALAMEAIALKLNEDQYEIVYNDNEKKLFDMSDFAPSISGYMYSIDNQTTICLQISNNNNKVTQFRFTTTGDTTTENQLMTIINNLRFASNA